MRKLIAIFILIAVLVIAGCAKKPSDDSNNTTEKKVEKPLFGSAKTDFASESVVIEKLNKSEYAKLFLGLYPEAKPVLSKKENPSVWVATYAQSGKNLTLTLNATSGDFVSSSIQLDYLKSGKYCKVDADCVNIGSSASALCINNIYAVKEGTSLGQASCYEGFQYCGCTGSICTKKSMPPNSALCASSPSNGSSSGSPASNPVSAGTTIACGSITELKSGQKAVSSNKTLHFVSTFEDSGQYGAKISVTTETETGTKYLRINAKDYVAAGVTVLIKDVIVEVGSNTGIATMSITGMDGTCTIG
ncbi:TPA: hypothetical protein H1012_02220 [archaeon]|nr:hypothetical protein [Candidatus Naiadarchaeales archaeon SRR2090159.bin1288]